MLQPLLPGAVDAAAMQKALGENLSLRIPVTVVATGTLPRFEMKAKRWIYE